MANVRITELDFDQIKTNLKDYLRNQSEFTDYDFEGSNLSVLLDILAYNTHYNAVLANMVNNEMFLDSAIKRSSITSLGKHLSYTPRSIRSSTSKVSLTLQNVTGTPNFVSIAAYTSFSASVDGNTLTFFNKDGYIATPVNGVYTFPEITLYQGRRLEYFWTIPANNTPANRYQIPNLNVDTTTLRVSVQYTTGYSEAYTLMSDVTQATADSKVYYLEENPLGYFDIFFGDGILGYNPSAGDIVKIDYLISDGVDGNVSTNVPITWTTNSLAGETEANRAITTIAAPQGGAAAETNEQVRFNALNSYSARGRTITANDYAGILSAEIPGAQSVNVWGGETNDPPVYGKVYISVKPRTGYVLTDSEKTRILDTILKPRAMITTRHEFVDPTYVYLNFETIIKYSPARTNRSANQIAALANTAITDYIASNLEKFNASYYASALQTKIAQLDDSIVSVILVNKIQRRINVISGTTFAGTLNFPGKIHPGEVKSSYFAYLIDNTYYTAQIRDVANDTPVNYNGTGTLEIYDANTGAVLNPNAGTVYYGTGHIDLLNVAVAGYVGGITDLRITAEMQEASRDFVPSNNEILVLDDSTANTVANLTNGINIAVESIVL